MEGGLGNRHVGGTYQLKGGERIEGMKVARKRNESELESFCRADLAFMSRAIRRASVKLEENQDATLHLMRHGLRTGRPGAGITRSIGQRGFKGDAEHSEQQNLVL